MKHRGNDLEREVIDQIHRRREELVEVARSLIRFDTTTWSPGDPPRDEARLQDYLAERLTDCGANVELWEPSPEDVAESRQVAPEITFHGRPQLVGRFQGTGGGRDLLFNGHIDVVSSEPQEQWTTPPNEPNVRNGCLYGRGACDMKGGIAAMMIAAETIAQLKIPLAGALIVNTVTDEETGGAGAVASIAHGVNASAGVVPEPTDFQLWLACRGALLPVITVAGRAGHSEIPHPHWSEGGPVNAIEKAVVILDALKRLRETWHRRSDHHHPNLPPGDIVPTMIRGGEWIVTYPASCTIACDVTYLPAHADENGWGTSVEREFADWIMRAAQADPWLAENPPHIQWGTDGPPVEISESEPIAQLLLGVAKTIGMETGVATHSAWHDGVAFTLFANTPTVAFGPRGFHAAHTVDEFVCIDDLVTCSTALALTAIRFCGINE